MKKAPIKTKTISRSCNIREWTYRAKVNVLTGALIEIRAGCRRWNDFEQAQEHYRMGSWEDTYIRNSLHYESNNACREEARALLRKLSLDVDNFRGKAQKKLRDARRAKKPIKRK